MAGIYRLLYQCFYLQVFVASGVISTSACGVKARGGEDILTCLNYIRTLANDQSSFWFGNNYRLTCPEDTVTGVLTCYNPLTNNTDSLLSRLFWSGQFNASRFDRYLNITYTSPKGQYEACGNTVRMKEYLHLTVDPIASRILKPWQTRKLPQVSWVQFDSEQKLYTLVFVDVGFGVVRSLYTNIPNTDLSKATVVIPYKGPLNFRDIPNPYVFLLFLQTSFVMISSKWQNRLKIPGYRFIKSFTDEHNLEGPVAINWVSVSTDLYATEQNRVSGFLDNCPYYIAKALEKHHRTFIPPNLNLSVAIYVSFSTDSLVYHSCCSKYKSMATTIYLNPLGDGTVKAVNTRSGLSPNITVNMLTFDAQKMKQFPHSLYTLIMVDPDIPDIYQSLGNSSYPLIHWMVLNIVGGKLSTGDELYTYMGPLPPDDNPHYYYFFLLKQPSRLASRDLEGFYSDCIEALKGRCLFRLRQFIHSHDLVFVGASWMVSNNDDYVRGVYISQGTPPDKVCRGTLSYQPDCPLLKSSNSSCLVINVNTTIFFNVVLGLLIARI